MSNFIASTRVHSKAGNPNSITYKIALKSGGKIGDVEVLEGRLDGARPRPYMFLDLLAEIMPSYLYTADCQVELGGNPVRHPYMSYQTHPCLIVTDQFGEKRYRLDQVVSEQWLTKANSVRLRAMVQWWREHRTEFPTEPHKWGYWKNEV